MGPEVLIGVTALIIVCVDLWLLASISKSKHSQKNKVIWALVVVLLPLFGWIIWARFGPRGMANPPVAEGSNKDVKSNG